MSWSKTGQVEEEVSPCEICGHESVRIVGGKPLCSAHLDQGGQATSSETIKTASERLTDHDE